MSKPVILCVEDEKTDFYSLGGIPFMLMDAKPSWSALDGDAVAPVKLAIALPVRLSEAAPKELARSRSPIVARVSP
jgi:hypothetical protein